MVVFSPGVLAQGAGSLRLDSHQNLDVGRSQVDLSVIDSGAILAEYGASEYDTLRDSFEDGDGRTGFAVNTVRVGSAYTRTGPNAGPPDPPRDLIASGGADEIKISWTPPADDGGSAITGYRLQWSSDAGANWGNLGPNNLVNTAVSHPNRQRGQTIHYRVRAINNDGNSDWSNIASAAAGTPDDVTGLTATASGHNQIDLSWTAPSHNNGAAVTGYRIQVSPDGTGNWTNLEGGNTNSTATTYSHTGLQSGTTYYYRVYAINSRGVSILSSNVVHATASATATAPGAPTGVTATATGRNGITLGWTAPGSNGGSAITGYRIWRSLDGQALWPWREIVPNTLGTGTTHIDGVVDAGTTYYYRVAAINSVGAGPPSAVAHATTEASAPDAPRNLTATASGPTRIVLSWTVPNDNGGVPITGYQIESSADGTDWGNPPLVENTGNNKTTYTDTGLTEGTTRYYRVSAINRIGTGAPSDEVSATTQAISAPDAPTNLIATASGQTRIDLSWTAPVNNGGAAITGYRIQVSSNGTGNWTNLAGGNTNSTATTYSHTGLTAGTTRHYRVRAINSVGAGAPSDVAHATTDAATVTAPEAPANLTATAPGPTRIDLSWTAPSSNGGSSITGYQIQVSPSGTGNWSPLVGNTRNTNTTYAHTDLSPGTTRHYRVRAINSVGAGAPSDVARATTTAATAPDAPSNLTATASGRTEITLSWSSPSNNGGTAVTGYQIEVSANAGGSWTNLETNTGSTSTRYTHTGLTEGDTRHYRVSAINSVGTGTPSNVASATTGAVTAPDAPTGLTATASGPDAILLSWSAPSNNGGAVITGYQIEWSTDAGDTWSDLVADTRGTATTYTHTGLAAATRYDYRISAINSVGTGTPSSVDYATTAAATAPDVPTELTAAASGPAEITLSWTAPSNNGGAAITGYRIQVSLDAGGTWTDLIKDTESAATTYTHTGLTEGDTRSYRVYAINAVGESADPSNVDHVVISVPDMPTELTATASGQTEIHLSWTAPSNPGGAPVSGYHIEVSSDAGETWSDLVQDTEGSETTYTHTGLAPGTTRHYRARAINPVGASAPSNVASATTEAALRPPGVPTNVEAVAEGQEAVNLSWSAPVDDGGTPVTGYQVEMSEDAGFTWEKLADVTATAYRHTFPPSAATRFYRVTARNAVGLGTPSGAVHVMPDPTTSIESLGEEIPTDFVLEQNYPNPFNPTTAIEFSLTRTGPVTLTVYDLLGQKVQTLLDRVQPAGRHSVRFSGTGLASDTYLYVLQTERERAVRMMTLLK